MDTTMSTSQNFMGVVIDTENGSNTPKIKKALDKQWRFVINKQDFLSF